MDSPLKRAARLDRSRQVAPQIIETLRERILSLSLKPNTLLSRAELQAEFGVSQTPVRDALLKLEQEGLVEIYPQHATVVAKIDIGAARQAHFLRIAIELEAVRRIAANPRPDFVDALKGRIEHQRRIVKSGDYGEFVHADRAFHRDLYEEARVPGLWDIIRRESGHLDRLRVLNLPLPGKIDEIVGAHSAIVESIERREPDAAAEALRRHLSGTLSIVNVIRERHPDFLVEE